LSSAYTWPGKILKPSTGLVVEGLAAHGGLMQAYQFFFIGAGVIGIPAIILFGILAARQDAPAQVLT